MVRFTFAGASGVATLLVTSLTALGIAYALPEGETTTLDAAAAGTVGAPARGPQVWTMSNLLEGTSCNASLGPHISSTYRAVEIDDACEAVIPASKRVVLWREGRDGSVALVDETGKLVIAFAGSDGGAALEAYEPREAMVSLSAQ